MVVLVLTLQGAAHRVVPERKALDLMRRGRAVMVVEANAPPVRWASGAVARPSVIYLTRHVPHLPARARPTRRAVLARDRHTCAYCGQPGPTVDHVHPLWRCRREGREANTWENLVTACEPCQRRKGGRTLNEAGMSFRSGFSPHAPRGSCVLLRDAPREWVPFLQPTPA